jgi:uncharacterized protein YcbK (DUF882 family)
VPHSLLLSPRTCVALVICSLTWLTTPASAERTHTVRSGQSLAALAKRYGVAVSQLAAHNGVARDAGLREGQTLAIPEPSIVYVARGDTLARIARDKNVDATELAVRNRLKPRAPLRTGQRLILPGYDDAGEPDEARKRWGVPRQRGTATLHRIWSKQTRRIRLLDARGRPRAEATRQLRELLRPRDSRRRKDPHPRLLRLLAQVSDHFGGRPIHVISGVRTPGGYTRETSRHVAGEAIDLRIPGVPLSALRDYCQRFERSGCGYYPNSHFVHIDVRRKSARWTDWSRPGQGPMLREPGEPSTAPSTASADASAPEIRDESALPDQPAAEDDGLPALDDEDL